MSNVLILGGTAEAVKLANELVAKGHVVITSLAGRTADPIHPAGLVRIGGFGGVAGLVHYLRHNRIEKLIDATHPFATQITENATEAGKQTGIEYERIERKVWEKQDGDLWIEVANLDAVNDVIPTRSRVFLALGSQYINAFNERNDVWFLVRMVDKPDIQLALPCLLYTSPSPRDKRQSRMPSSA